MNLSKVRLTEAVVESLPVHGRDTLVFDAMEAGFGVRVTPAGAKIFVAQARVNGRSKRVAVGHHPKMSVADARREARTVLQDMRAGKNPIVEKEVRRQALARGAITVDAFLDRWLAEYVRAKLKPFTVRDYERIVAQVLRPRFGARLLASITKDDALRLHGEMQGTPRRANYVIAVLRGFMTYAEDCGLRPAGSNPAKKIKLYAERQVERFLSEAEIGRVADAIASCEADGSIGPFAAAGLRLALLTGARAGEITAIEWSHVNVSRRWIRLPDSKTGAKTIHLSSAAMDVLIALPRVGPYVIAGADPEKPYARLTNAWLKVRAKAGLKDVRLHDLRHTFASVAAAKGFSLPMIGRLLGHKVPATTARYAHLATDAAAAANEEIGAALDAAISAKKPPDRTVVPLKPKRAGRAGR